ncbi:MAG: transporter [Alphaproteobacteria bacterium]|nr:transporter [Alphaproteobacteria bacterium]
MRIRIFLMTAGLMACTTINTAQACEICNQSESQTNEMHFKASSHAPIGVMGDHRHKAGEWMLSYRFKHMEMAGNRDGTDDLSVADVLTYANPNPGPANLRVVPTKMGMDMHMFGAMYAPTDWLTLMAMGMYMDKDMDHITYNMPATAELGRFTTRAKGWGDTSFTGLVRLYEDGTHKLHLNAGVSVPTGSIKEEDEVLTPMNTRTTLRLPYAMQLGTGTYDALPGVTYSGHDEKWIWGAQYSARIPLEDENDQGYAWGNKHSVSAWAGYEWAPWISTSARLTGTRQGKIKGSDSQIAAPVQTADPENYGGRALDLGLGVNLLGTRGALKGQRVAFEIEAPLYRDLNGPQLETDWTATVGWQYAF